MENFSRSRAQFRTESEGGFALIAAIWLLVIAGSVASLFMLHAMKANRNANDERLVLRDALAIDGALDTVTADLLIRGVSSRWNQVGKQYIDLDGVQILVSVSDENVRLDLNRADIATIGEALRRAKVSQTAINGIVERIAELRQSKKAVNSLADLDKILESGQSEADRCLTNEFTINGSTKLDVIDRQSNNPDSSDPSIARIVAAGHFIRARFRSPSGQAKQAIFRVAPGPADPGLITSWQSRIDCIR